MVQVLSSGLKKYTAEEIRGLNHFYRDVYYRLHNRDQNFLFVITGGTGSGKSFAALRMAQKIDPNFTDNMEKNIVYFPEEFMDRVYDPELYQGAVLIWEEVGTAISSKDWYSIINKQIGYVIQTFRKKHICLIMTVPSTDFMDSTVRKLVNAIGRMIHIDRKNMISKMRVWYVNYESNIKKWYFKKPIITIYETGERFKITHLNMPKVDAESSRRYEKIRAEFVRKLGLQVKSELDVARGKMPKKMDVPTIVKKVIDNQEKYRHIKTGRLSYVKIQYEYGLSKNKAYEVKALVESMLGEA